MSEEQQLLEYIKDNFYTDIIEREGRFVWKVRRRGIRFGREAGTLNDKGYKQIQIKGNIYRSHRLVWLWVYNKFPNNQIDHIDGDRTNNHISNLRDVTNRENSKNRRIPRNNKSGVIGVSWCRYTQRWKVHINTSTGQNKTMGRFESKSEAIRARKEAEFEFGYHQNHGRVSE